MMTDTTNKSISFTVDPLKDLTATGDITAGGNINASGKIQEGGHELLPKGSIIMWAGTKCPEGWSICNGTNGTVDLRNRFIVGAGDQYHVKKTGGQDEVQLLEQHVPGQFLTNNAELTVSKQNKHMYEPSKDDPTCHSSLYEPLIVSRDQPHENRPPYYALTFIMKIS